METLLPLVKGMKQRFGLKRVCWVADRGMASRETIEGLEELGIECVLGARMRRQKEVREDILGRAGRYKEVADNFQVKDVLVEGRRYIVCYNPQ